MAPGERCRGQGMNAVFGTLPLIICLVLLVVNNFRIWKYVRQQAEAHSERLSFARNAYEDSERPSTITHSDRALQRFKESQKQHQERLQLQRSQAFYFVGSFFCLNILTYILRAAEVLKDSSVGLRELPYKTFPLLVLRAFLYPLQVSSNMFIWLRPAYIRFRTHCPAESKLWCLRQAIFADHVESLGRNENEEPVIKDARRTGKLERRKTALSSNASGGGDSSRKNLSPPEIKPIKKNTKDGDTAESNRYPEASASMVKLDGSVQSMSNFDNE